jgi:phosphoglucosamine mutase
VRASGTEPLVRVMVEAADDARCDSLCEEIAAVVRSEIGIEE